VPRRPATPRQRRGCRAVFSMICTRLTISCRSATSRDGIRRAIPREPEVTPVQAGRPRAGSMADAGTGAVGECWATPRGRLAAALALLGTIAGLVRAVDATESMPAGGGKAGLDPATDAEPQVAPNSGPASRISEHPVSVGLCDAVAVADVAQSPAEPPDRAIVDHNRDRPCRPTWTSPTGVKDVMPIVARGSSARAAGADSAPANSATAARRAA
jgi:hypothetical protein